VLGCLSVGGGGGGGGGGVCVCVYVYGRVVWMMGVYDDKVEFGR